MVARMRCRSTSTRSPGSGLPSLTYDGGAGSDALNLSGTAANVAHTFDNAAAGDVNVDGYTISYTGLEPISDLITVADRTFTFNNDANTITISDPDLGSDDGISRISSNASETVDFVNPTASLTVNAAGGFDTITIEGLDPLTAGVPEIEDNSVRADGTPFGSTNFGTGSISPAADNDFWSTTGDPRRFGVCLRRYHAVDRQCRLRPDAVGRRRKRVGDGQ